MGRTFQWKSSDLWRNRLQMVFLPRCDVSGRLVGGTETVRVFHPNCRERNQLNDLQRHHRICHRPAFPISVSRIFFGKEETRNAQVGIRPVLRTPRWDGVPVRLCPSAPSIFPGREVSVPSRIHGASKEAIPGWVSRLEMHSLDSLFRSDSSWDHGASIRFWVDLWE